MMKMLKVTILYHFIRLSALSSYAVYVAFEVAAVQEFGQDVLVEGWDCAGVKRYYTFQFCGKLLWEQHVAYAD